jgi:hypothetical protein
MAHREVIATRTGRYGTRMLTAGDALTLSGPAARAMIALGRAEEKPRRARRAAPAPQPADERPPLREAYRTKFGRAAFNGWDADTLREKIAGAE